MAENTRKKNADTESGTLYKRSTRVLPEGSANWVSWLTFSWVGNLVVRAWRHPIDDDDLYTLPAVDSSAPVTEVFEEEWRRREREEAESQGQKSKYGLLWVIISVHRYVAIKSMFLDLSVIAFTLATPEILKRITGTFEEIENGVLPATARSDVYWWSALLLAMEMCRLLFGNCNLWLIVRAGVRVRTALMGSMYGKALLLTGAARQRFSLGRAVNIMSSDVLRIDTGWIMVNIFWTTPILIVFVIVMVARIIGWAAAAGALVLALYLPVQWMIVSRLNWYRDRINEIADRRIKMLQEVLFGIRVIKLYAWEARFQARVNELRAEELRLIRRMKMLAAISQTLTISVPTFITVISLVVYSKLNGSVSSSVIFPAMAYFDILETPLNFLPITISYTVDALAAIRRVQAFLRAPVLVFQPEVDASQEEAVLIEDGLFAWDNPAHPMPKDDDLAIDESDSESKISIDKVGDIERQKREAQGRRGSLTVPKAGVYDVEEKRWMPSTPTPFTGIAIPHFAIKRGSLVAVVGPVGSGKSSLLGCIMGEMYKVSGRVVLCGQVGYTTQHAWIRNGSIRENILFGLPWEPIKYEQVIKQCALEADLSGMPDGDATEIGEHGVCLSGGQKQRVSLARLVYSEPDISLLDDPLSAVDPHVGKVLFQDCIVRGRLSKTTRVLVTHQLNVLPHCDHIVVMQHGQIAEQGSYQKLMSGSTAFSVLLKKYAQAEAASEPHAAQSSTVTVGTQTLSPGTLHTGCSTPTPGTQAPASPQLIKNEREAIHRGEVSLTQYLEYAAFAGGAFFLATAFATGFLSESGRAYSDLWLKWWPDADDDPEGMSDRSFMLGLTLIGMFQMAMTWFNALVFVLAGYFASLTLHQLALKRVLRSPIRFFDTTPAGRILNRFSKDLDLMDSNLPEELNNLMFAASVILSTLVITYICNWRLLPAMALPLALGVLLQSVFSAAARQLWRLNIAAFSPLLSHFSETYVGLSVIRALRKQPMFVARHHLLNDVCNRSYLLYASLRRWTSFRSETIGCVLTLAIAWIGTWYGFSASVFGLAITQALKITRALDWSIKQLAETEISMVSAERVMEYAERLESERAMVTDTKPPADWPARGHIQFVNLVVRYRPSLPPVLKDVNLEFLPHQRIAIVGRTGAGKSTILAVLFRLVEPAAGQIIIDGLDICSLGLEDLRTRLAIVPQEPVLFAGTLRFNLDPLGQYTDEQLWTALDRTHMRETVVRMGGGSLEMAVMENGDNFSIGQKQLLCLARAVLKPTSVLVLDEATANIDLETDSLIQQSLRENFAATHTIITIAHRLNTIIDYDKVVVMRAGEVAEFDSPTALMAKPDSIFSQMIRESSPTKASQTPDICSRLSN